MASRSNAERARRSWRALEPVHGMIYFAPEALEQYSKLGITHHRMGYFASRSAPMGAVPAEVVIATFFNFYPLLVHKAIPAAWDVTTPAAMIEARFAAADQALRRAFGDEVGSADMARLAELARSVALVACETPEGRPLFAGHVTVEWPDDPHLVVWHAQTLLREFRGDGHVAVLTTAGLTAVEALVVHGATGQVPDVMLQGSRAWPEDLWAAGVESVSARGWLAADGTLTQAGRAHREQVEADTDTLAARAYARLSEDDAETMVQLSRRFSRMVVDGGLLAPDSLTAARAD
ncbi:MAG TPA: hypothetical protein VFX21_16750 [Acidimicrobiia bacterium]|nr:hypothetical protein [Acidimicrobiia bacterium]